MLAYLGIIGAGIALRQVDRWWFSPAYSRQSAKSLEAVLALQRSRANNLTPVLLLAGHWLELAGWWEVAAHGGPVGWAVAALTVAVKFRHLQEVSHFAVHGVLTASTSVGTSSAEMAVHATLGFVPVSERREKHVRRHHPNATISGVDPNLTELQRAGMYSGASTARFALAVVFPLTPTGLADTIRNIASALRPRGASWWRLWVFAAIPAAALLIGWPTLVFAYAVPRLVLYPQLAWLSLLVEHRWFDDEPADGSPAVTEAARCLRLYPRNTVLALFARATWLPYGDLFHYAHSVHPAVRWNYLPALEAALGAPAYTPHGLLLGGSAVIPYHRRMLNRGQKSSIPGTTLVPDRDWLR